MTFAAQIWAANAAGGATGRGLQYTAKAVEIARRQGLFSLLPLALEHHAKELLRAGRLDPAYVAAQEGYGLSIELGHGAGWHLATMAYVEGVVCASSSSGYAVKTPDQVSVSAGAPELVPPGVPGGAALGTGEGFVFPDIDAATLRLAVSDAGLSAPAAELPVEDLDVEALVHSSSSTAEEDVNGVSRGRLKRHHASGWSCLVGCEQLAVDDQALPRQSPEVDRRYGRCMLAHLGPEVRDHQEARVDCLPRELPHRPAKQVLEAADEVVLKQARTVYGSRSTNS